MSAQWERKSRSFDAKEEFIEGALEFLQKNMLMKYLRLYPFAGYGFNKSHGRHILLLHIEHYLKAHFPAEFIAANLINEITRQPEYIAEGRAMGIAQIRRM